MTQEDKDLLLQDLCGRIPYGVKCKIGNYDYIICDISLERQYDVFYNSGRDFPIGVIGTEDNGNTFHTSVYEKHVKPYLFPLSSMTEEQCEKFKIISGWDGEWEDIKRGKFSCIGYIGLDYIYDTVDWLNKNHFDYRGLIEKGLAVDATGLNIY